MRRAALVLGKDPKMLGVPFAAEWMRQRGHSIKSTLNAVVGTVKMMEVQQVGPGSKLQHLGISTVVGTVGMGRGLPHKSKHCALPVPAGGSASLLHRMLQCKPQQISHTGKVDRCSSPAFGVG